MARFPSQNKNKRRLRHPFYQKEAVNHIKILWVPLRWRGCSFQPCSWCWKTKLKANEGVTQSISSAQAKDLLEAPDPKTLKGKRDRAILATFLFHALRRSELCNLKIKDMLEREGIKQLKILGKGEKERYVPLHPVAITRIYEYLEASGLNTPVIKNQLFLEH